MQTTLKPRIKTGASLLTLTALVATAPGLLAGCDGNRPVQQTAESLKKGGPVITVNDDFAQIGTLIDISKFSFEQKSQFKNYIESRLDAVERAVKSLKESAGMGVAIGSGTSRTQPDPNAKEAHMKQIAELESAYKNVEKKLGKISKAESQRWDLTKSEFRDDVEKLEKQYQDILTASR